MSHGSNSLNIGGDGGESLFNWQMGCIFLGLFGVLGNSPGGCELAKICAPIAGGVAHRDFVGERRQIRDPSNEFAPAPEAMGQAKGINSLTGIMHFFELAKNDLMGIRVEILFIEAPKEAGSLIIT
jgi:hypothetical protein